MSLICMGRKAKSLLGPRHAVHVIGDVITPDQEASLVDELNPLLRRRRYQRDHWDQVIVGYKEIERPFWTDLSNELLVTTIRDTIKTTLTSSHDSRQQDAVEDTAFEWLPVHVIDLEETGYISPHVDSIKFSGHLVCGLSLLSSSIMTLRPDRDDECALCQVDTDSDENIHLYLPPRSLYILSGNARYKFTHGVDIQNNQDILNELSERNYIDSHKFKANILESDDLTHRSRRISLIFRDEKN